MVSPAQPVVSNTSMIGRGVPLRAHARRSFEYRACAAYAALLALVTLRHAMWRDELQAWLIARDSHSLLELLHTLRYEGHPALWYLLLYLPAHLSWNPAAMQALNYVLSLATAGLILSAREIPRAWRLLFVTSYFFFYQYGVIARSYELTVLLLIAASRCLLTDRPRPRLAALLLGLAVNAHFFAVPVAIVMALWYFVFAEPKRHIRLHHRDLRSAALTLSIALLACYLTVRPAPDISPQVVPQVPLGAAFLDVGSSAWQMFLPYLPSAVRLLIGPLYSAAPACVLSLAFFSAAVFVLRSRQARLFFLASALTELPAMALSIRTPDVYHFGIIFAAWFIALCMDGSAAAADGAQHRASHFTMPRAAASSLLLSALAMQTLSAAAMSALEWHRPYSAAKEAAAWLKQNRLDRNPLVLEPSETLAIVGYLQRPSAYDPSCRCFASYALRDTRREMERVATRDDLQAARGDSSLPVVLVSNTPIDPARLSLLGLVEIHATSQRAFQQEENFVIYIERRSSSPRAH